MASTPDEGCRRSGGAPRVGRRGISNRYWARVELVGAVATAIALFRPRLKLVFGVIERLFTLSVILWLYAMATSIRVWALTEGRNIDSRTLWTVVTLVPISGRVDRGIRAILGTVRVLFSRASQRIHRVTTWTASQLVPGVVLTSR